MDDNRDHGGQEAFLCHGHNTGEFWGTQRGSYPGDR